jgi:hypothetical protein
VTERARTTLTMRCLMNSNDDPANAPSSDGGSATSSGGLMCERLGRRLSKAVASEAIA